MNLKPGIYKATVRGVPDQIVMLRNVGTVDVDPWVSLGDLAGGPSSRWFRNGEITDARPLIMLDLGDTPPFDVVAVLRSAASHRASIVDGLDINRIADQIEAQTKPPRIPEPGLWGVVEANVVTGRDRLIWLRRGKTWHSDRGWAEWDELTDPVLIREGVTS